MGLTCDPGGDTAVCSLLRVGSLTSGHAFSSGQAAVDETFAASVIPTYDAAGNIAPISGDLPTNGKDSYATACEEVSRPAFLRVKISPFEVKSFQ